jgi:hypothetical protein
MPRACTACRHEQSAQITKDIAAGVSYRSISSQYGITVSAGHRHALKCLRLARRGEQAPKGAQGSAQGAQRLAPVRPRAKSANSSRNLPTAPDGRCPACQQLTGDGDAKLGPEDIVRRAERVLFISEGIAAQAQASDDARLALQSVDRCQRSIEALAKMAGLLAPDNQTIVINEATKVRMTADEAIAAILGEITGEAAQSAFLEAMQVALGIRSELSDRARSILAPVTLESIPALNPG